MGLMRRVSVRWRLTIVAAGVFAVALTVASFVLVRSVHNNLVASIRQTDRQELAQLANQLQNGTPPGQLGYNGQADRGMRLHHRDDRGRPPLRDPVPRSPPAA